MPDTDYCVRRHQYDDAPDVVEIAAGGDTLTVDVARGQTLLDALRAALDDTSDGE